MCTNAAPKGQPKLRHVLKRPNGQIAREVDVCAECHEELKAAPLAAVISNRRPMEVSDKWVNEPVL